MCKSRVRVVAPTNDDGLRICWETWGGGAAKQSCGDGFAFWKLQKSTACQLAFRRRSNGAFFLPVSLNKSSISSRLVDGLFLWLYSFLL